MTLAPTLETERLWLRALKESDFDSFVSFYDSELAEYYGGRCDRNTAWRRFLTFSGQWNILGYGVWGMEDKSTGKFTGICGPWFPKGWPEREISWALMPGHLGKGYATEGASRALQFVYQELGWATAISLIDRPNAASLKLAERLGAVFESDYSELGFDGIIYRHLSAKEHARLNQYG